MSVPNEEPDSAATTLATRLEAARRELLDLGLRNPLLHFRLSKAQGVAMVQEDAVSVFDVLVRQGKAMSFVAAPEASKRPAPARQTQPTAASDDLPAMTDYLVENPPLLPTEAERLALLTDSKLQTAEPLAKLESRLQKTYYTARTSLEETGANILYLALGMLTWYDEATPTEPRLAPLVLVPVLLERSTAAERYRLRHTGGEVAGNLSLQAKLKASFNLALPLPEPDEDGALADYYAAVAAAVAGRPGWQVEVDNLALSFFSFGKFLLYRDLDPATWPAGAGLLEHPAIGALLGAGAGFQDAPPTVGETAFLDTDSPAAELHQVLEADSSQLLALLAVHEGRNLVMQGPPGTGKSQTIANLLAEAIGAGKKVLFVAEKMAALEVVKRRLDALGLGAACLEVHSNKANKKALHDELRQTLSLGRPAAAARVADQVTQLPRYRQALNDYALAVNAPLGRSRHTAQQLAGELLTLAEVRGPALLPRVAFARLADWTDADAAHAEALATRLQATLQKIGPPQALLFWGSELTVHLPADHDALTHLLSQATLAVQVLQAAAEALAHQLGLPAPTSRLAAEALLPAARQAQLAPPLAGAHATDAAWLPQAARLTEVLQAGAAHQALRQQHEATLLPEAWTQPLLPERAALLTYGDKWWKFLVGDYRRARQRLQGLWRGPLPKPAAEVLPVVEAVLEAARYAQVVAEAAPLGPLFGDAWQGERSDWPALRRVQEYLTLTHQRIARGELPAALLGYLASATSPAAVAAPLAALEHALNQQRTAVQAIADALRLNEARRFGPDGRLQFQPFAGQLATLAAWAADLPALRLATEWNNVAATAHAEHLPELLPLAETWPAAGQYLALAVRQTWLEYLQRLAYEQYPALRQFERASHEEVAARFRLADADSLYHNRIRAMRQHFDNLPNTLAGGQMLVIKNEFAKKARHLPLRQLMARAGRAVQAIKPVFMMSPLSVASFLPPGAVEFDLVVFDEASQVKPVDALGAVARGRQLVVVGDSQQLPPTSFFDSLTGLDEAPDEDSATADIQSILELCKARQMPECELRWHYRSRHESLIAAANRLFYKDNLVVFPSPGGQGPLGLVYHHLPGTYYERGTTRTNPQEAAAVAQAVLAHARATPWLTLGVVAFSTAQRQAIQEALEGLRRQQPEAEEFFSGHAHEPFFIKNLENVQGDERDVILISLGYGRTQQGTVALNFGPLGRPGGARRLNVLITRAKQRCEVFTNLTGADLDVTRLADGNPQTGGIAALQAFLHFAQTGQLPPTGGAPGPVAESPFEEVVGRALAAQGYTVRPQVGSAGFYLDLAVVDPDAPDRYVLGIECDGAMYHRARSARDRNRLRQAVLEGMGWHLHRIWSADWFRDPTAALARAVAAIEAARRLAAPAPPTGPAAAAPAVTPTVLARDEPPAPDATPAAAPYQVAQLPPAIRQRELHQHPVGRLAAWVAEVVAVESPVHLEEVTRRLATATGAAQVGARMRASVAEAARLAEKIGSVRVQGDFYWTPSMAASAAPVRDRSALPPVSRKPGFVAPEELAAAVCAVVRGGFALERAAVALPAARLLGFTRPGDEQRQLLEVAIDKLVLENIVTEKNGVLTPGPPG